MKLLTLTTAVATLLSSVLARSSVHSTFNNDNNRIQLDITPEVSMNAFSMFSSHILDSTAKHPALRLQDQSQMVAMQGVEELKPFIPASSNPFEKRVDASLVVLISGVNTPEDLFDTSFYVDDDDFEHYSSMMKQIEEELEEKEDVALVAYRKQKITIHRDSKVEERETSEEDIDFETTALDKEIQADKHFLAEVQVLYQLEESDYQFIEVNTLQTLLQTYGADSEQYKEAVSILKSLFTKHLIPNVEQHQRFTTTFIMTPPSNKQMPLKRDATTSSALKKDENGTCFVSLEACNNATSSCQGHGQCKPAAEKCYACQCEASYLGDSCQYVDAVGEFQLLFWTSVFLIVVTSSVVFCVYQSGSNSDGGIIMTQSVTKHE